LTWTYFPSNALSNEQNDISESTANNQKINSNGDGQECQSHTYYLLHGADSDIAANIFHAHNQNVASIEQAYRSQNISKSLHGYHFTPEVSKVGNLDAPPGP
jgi:hypothetical protein